MKLWKALALSSLVFTAPFTWASDDKPMMSGGMMMQGQMHDPAMVEHYKKMDQLHEAMAATMKELKALPQQCDKGSDSAKCLEQVNQRLNLMMKWMEQMDECQRACSGMRKGMCKNKMSSDKVDLQSKPQ